MPSDVFFDVVFQLQSPSLFSGTIEGEAAVNLFEWATYPRHNDVVLQLVAPSSSLQIGNLVVKIETVSNLGSALTQQTQNIK